MSGDAAQQRRRALSAEAGCCGRAKVGTAECELILGTCAAKQAACKAKSHVKVLREPKLSCCVARRLLLMRVLRESFWGLSTTMEVSGACNNTHSMRTQLHPADVCLKSRSP